MRRKTATVETVAEDLKELLQDARNEGWSQGHESMESAIAAALGEEGNDVN
jgi:DNA-binding IclR family transcriptional regulator